MDRGSGKMARFSQLTYYQLLKCKMEAVQSTAQALKAIQKTVQLQTHTSVCRGLCKEPINHSTKVDRKKIKLVETPPAATKAEKMDLKEKRLSDLEHLGPYYGIIHLL